jgi:selenocysteine-specific elongation factor
MPGNRPAGSRLSHIPPSEAGTLDGRIIELIESAHRAEPWALGSTLLALARRLDLPEPPLLDRLRTLVEDGRLVRRFGYFALSGHTVVLSPEQQAFFASLLAEDETPAPIAYAIIAGDVRSSDIAGIAKAFDTLLATGALIRVGNDCYRGAHVVAMQRLIEAHFRANVRLTVAEFRDFARTTRKHAVPLLEWFDDRGVTSRDGVDRVRGGAPLVANEGSDAHDEL